MGGLEAKKSSSTIVTIPCKSNHIIKHLAENADTEVQNKTKRRDHATL